MGPPGPAPVRFSSWAAIGGEPRLPAAQAFATMTGVGLCQGRDPSSTIQIRCFRLPLTSSSAPSNLHLSGVPLPNCRLASIVSEKGGNCSSPCWLTLPSTAELHMTDSTRECLRKPEEFAQHGRSRAGFATGLICRMTNSSSWQWSRRKFRLRNMSSRTANWTQTTP